MSPRVTFGRRGSFGLRVLNQTDVRPTMVQVMVVEEQLKCLHPRLPLHLLPKHWAVLLAFKCPAKSENGDDTWLLWRAEYGPVEDTQNVELKILRGKGVDAELKRNNGWNMKNGKQHLHTE